MRSPKTIALLLACVLAVSACSETPAASTEREASPPLLDTRLLGEVVFETDYIDDEYGRIWVDGFDPQPEIVDGVLFIEARNASSQRFSLQLDATSGELLALSAHETDFTAGCSAQNRHLDLRLDGEVLDGQQVVARDPWSGATRWTRPAPDGCQWAVDDLGQVWERAQGKLRLLRPADGSVIWEAELPTFASVPEPSFLLPAVDEPGLLVVQGLNELVAFDAVTGEERWRRDESGMRVLYVSDQIVLVADDEVTFPCGSNGASNGSVTALRSADGSVAWTEDVPENGELVFAASGPYGNPDPLGRDIVLRIRSLDFDTDDRATSIETTWIDEASGADMSAPNLLQASEAYNGATTLTFEPGLTYSFDRLETTFALDGTPFHTRSERPGQRIHVLDEFVLITGMTLTAIR